MLLREFGSYHQNFLREYVQHEQHARPVQAGDRAADGLEVEPRNVAGLQAKPSFAVETAQRANDRVALARQRHLRRSADHDAEMDPERLGRADVGVAQQQLQLLREPVITVGNKRVTPVANSA